MSEFMEFLNVFGNNFALHIKITFIILAAVGLIKYLVLNSAVYKDKAKNFHIPMYDRYPEKMKKADGRWYFAVVQGLLNIIPPGISILSLYLVLASITHKGWIITIISAYSVITIIFFIFQINNGTTKQSSSYNRRYSLLNIEYRLYKLAVYITAYTPLIIGKRTTEKEVLNYQNLLLK